MFATDSQHAPGRSASRVSTMAPVGLLALVLCAGSAAAQAGAQAASPLGASATELPLTVLSATPAFLVAPSVEPISIGPDEAVQVVYSRAVVPLGSSPTDPAPSQIPFTVSGAPAGRFRWLNSYVASFEPEGSWGTDTTFQFSWNTGLTTFDGVPLQGTERLQVRRLGRSKRMHCSSGRRLESASEKYYRARSPHTDSAHVLRTPRYGPRA